MYLKDDNLKRHYFLWIKSSCPFCVKTTELLKEQKVDFTSYDFCEKQDLLGEVKNNFSWPTVPMVLEIRSDGIQSFIGGYTDVCKWFGKEPAID